VDREREDYLSDSQKKNGHINKNETMYVSLCVYLLHLNAITKTKEKKKRQESERKRQKKT
jgi:hypothetical protein